MTANEQWQQNSTDPLGLRELESIEPDFDGWDEIEAALDAHHQNRRNWRRAGGALAIAASLVLVVSITLLRQQDVAPVDIPVTGSATLAENSTSVTDEDNVKALIGLSQTMEEQLMKLRQSTGSMPADTAIYVAEIEDLIAQVDVELSVTPDSVDLWGQRVNLMLDLAQVYQQQWEIDYGRMAAL
ncbi:MAG: hypothetical protein OQJ84_05530 [Xanthomonadales bacterium]|nr:hypothetical protein [Xanthomonadales bacterium]